MLVAEVLSALGGPHRDMAWTVWSLTIWKHCFVGTVVIEPQKAHLIVGFVTHAMGNHVSRHLSVPRRLGLPVCTGNPTPGRPNDSLHDMANSANLLAALTFQNPVPPLEIHSGFVVALRVPPTGQE